MNNFGIDSGTIEIFRRLEIGTVYGVLILGVCLFAARFVLRWQLRRFEKLMARKEADEAARKSAPADEHEHPPS